MCTFLWLPPWFLGGEPATATVNLGVSLLCLFADFLAGDEPAAKGGSRPLDMYVAADVLIANACIAASLQP